MSFRKDRTAGCFNGMLDAMLLQLGGLGLSKRARSATNNAKHALLALKVLSSEIDPAEIRLIR